jgi:hypothetical protein
MGRTILDKIEECLLSGLVPMPRILESGNLCIGFMPTFIFEEDIVSSARVKWWVEINQINAFIGYVFPKNWKIIAIKESISV